MQSSPIIDAISAQQDSIEKMTRALDRMAVAIGELIDQNQQLIDLLVNERDQTEKEDDGGLMRDTL